MLLLCVHDAKNYYYFFKLCLEFVHLLVGDFQGHDPSTVNT